MRHEVEHPLRGKALALMMKGRPYCRCATACRPFTTI